MTQKPLEKLSPNILSNIFACTLSSQDFQQCLRQAKYLTPKIGKFWYGNEAQAGIYIVLSGKVRLLDINDQLISTIEANNSFGEFTLFPECYLNTYDARASMNLELCFISAETINPLFISQPQIKQQLWQQAQTRDSLQVKSAELFVDNESDVNPAWSVSPDELSAISQTSPHPKIGK
ncbi:MAG: hypothetical protein RLZZ535_2262, partial [Cyanobacteriota bacterium]